MKETKTHIYFWGGIFSQWYNSPFEFKDHNNQLQKVNRAEAYMMYQKAILFEDFDIAKKILETSNPKKQKELGRQVKNFNESKWAENRLDIVIQGNLLKFSQNEKLKEELLTTEEKVLVEGSPYDKVWGVGLKWDDEKILDEKNWKGLNLLGKSLMRVRDILRSQNGDKLEEFFDQPELSQDEYKKEVNKEIPDKYKDLKNAQELISDDFMKSGRELKSIVEREEVTSANFEEKLLKSTEEALAHAKGDKDLQSVDVKYYDKLIRDKIPQVIHKNKKQCDVVNEKDKNKLLKYYVKKLDEELKEVKESKNKKELIEELADLAEVIDGLIDNFEFRENFETIKKEKLEKKGGFSNLVLKTVRSEKHDWFVYKTDKFRSCKKCGAIENNKNIDENCAGKQKITLRDSESKVDPITLASAINEKVHEEKPTGKKVKIKNTSISQQLKVSDKDYDKIKNEIDNPSEPNEKLKKAFKDHKITFSKDVLYCPKCGEIHIDSGEWAKKLHHKHLCLHCDHIWELDEYVFGISLEEKKLLKNLEKGMKDVKEGKGISTKELKDKLKSNLFKEVQGSILDAQEDIIAQGCNCSGASGAGIAKYISQEYPESDKKYKEFCKKKKFHLGTVLFHKEKGKVQAFCGTQKYYGKFLKMDNDSVEKRYQAIEECLVKIYNKAKSENLSVALPRIGCGRARADWNRVKEIIKKVFHDYPVTVYWIPDKYSKK